MDPADTRRRRKPAFPVLFIQLVAANIVVAGTVTLLLYLTFDNLTEAYFHRLMVEFNISPTKLNAMFVDDVERSLVWGVGLSLGIGVLLSFLLTRVVLRPMAKMARATEKIAAGDYTARAPAVRGELGALAWHFNAMAGTLERQYKARRQMLRDPRMRAAMFVAPVTVNSPPRYKPIIPMAISVPVLSHVRSSSCGP